MSYDSFLKKISKIKFANLKNYFPNDEWDSITLNYTSGTTGDPKGVLYHHRSNLMCFNNQMVWKMEYQKHIYGHYQCFIAVMDGVFIWTIVALAGTQVCTNKV